MSMMASALCQVALPGSTATPYSASSRIDKEGNRHSNIFPKFTQGDVITTPRTQAPYMVTEYGVARIIGKSTGLHPFFVLISVSAAGAVGGLLWMILAVPLAGIIKVLLEKWAQSQ